MVVGGLWYLAPVLLLDMLASVKLDQLGESVTLLSPTVLVFMLRSLMIGENSCSNNSRSAHTSTY